MYNIKGSNWPNEAYGIASNDSEQISQLVISSTIQLVICPEVMTKLFLAQPLTGDGIIANNAVNGESKFNSSLTSHKMYVLPTWGFK